MFPYPYVSWKGFTLNLAFFFILQIGMFSVEPRDPTDCVAMNRRKMMPFFGFDV